MRKKASSPLTLIIALVCIIGYMSALLFAAYRIYYDSAEQQALAKQEFYALASAVPPFAGGLGFMSAEFQDAVQDTLNQSKTLEGAIISWPDGEFPFEQGQSAAVVREADSLRFRKQFGVSRTPIVDHLRIEGLRNVTISGVYRLFDYDRVIAVLKQTLLAVLGALSLSFLTFLFQLVSGTLAGGNKQRRAKTASPKREKYAPDPPPVYEAAASTEFSNKERELAIDFDAAEDQADQEYRRYFHQEPERSAAPEFAEDASLPPPRDEGGEELFDFSAEDQADQTDNGVLADAFTEDNWADLDSSDFSAADAAVEEAGLVERDSGGAVQVQPRFGKSNLGWEAYTLDRLASELHRVSSAEQDLVLMVIEYQDPGEQSNKPEGEIYNQLTETAVAYFNLRDLIFEKGARGMVVIIPHIDLDEGFVKAGEFYNLIPPSFAKTIKFGVGLSSRAGRLVNAERLLLEASEALDRALQDPVSPIVAFKSDPEKYRAYIRARQ
jgi:hypothetical protein